MNEGEASAYREAFLKANARREFIAGQLADVFRHLMRAVSSDDGPIYKASEQMQFVMDLIQRCDEPLTWWGIFSDAVQEIRSNIPEDSDDRRYIRAAERGVKYLVELSATDNAARGRASKRLDEFQSAIRWSQEARSRR